MLDLKAKLLAAGLVTKDQVDKVEADERAKQEARAAREAKKSARGNGAQGGHRHDAPTASVEDDAARDAARWQKRVQDLKAAGKAEQYDAIRGWVDRHRLDVAKGISESAQRFHFMKADQTISWISVEPDVRAKLAAGEAGIVAYMSNNGLTHAVVPKELANDVLTIRPDWLRVLHGVTDKDAPQDDAALAAALSPGGGAAGPPDDATRSDDAAAVDATVTDVAATAVATATDLGTTE